ncbi:DUF1593 domain-containing protein [uncultured Draconibacterium sp.]|uniref:DUF1593 domain-containing protein n=1 Tax=uncultured Draconibacterium sp. TaxID=1573823 RepID=UPI0025D62B6E|nr:DUF1593 domain-containing protein [uncultured Draconibacterium sp.]
MHIIEKSYKILTGLILSVLFFSACGSKQKSDTATDTNIQKPYRVIVTSDIGGNDPDDFQSMVHLLLYADVLDIEGIIASPKGAGRVENIHEVINEYEKDYPSLVSYSEKYPTADSLRIITKQGGVEVAGYKGYDDSSDGSEWIIQCARRDDPRPLYVLVWGGLEDVAQALHDAPDILPKLRVHWIGGPNKKWGPDAYLYIAEHHPNLWIIESNATYRGWFTGGNQSGEWSNTGFTKKYIKDKGALGTFFMSQLGGKLKMGDTPSLAWLLKGDPENPSEPGWGGQFVRTWERAYYHFTRMPDKTDSVQEFSILEIVLPVGKNLPENPDALLQVENQLLKGHFLEDDSVRFRFCPKSDKYFSFKISSNVPVLDGVTGGITALITPSGFAKQPSEKYPNWWTDDPDPELAEGNRIGAKTVSKWRVDFLTDFAKKMERCQVVNNK